MPLYEYHCDACGRQFELIRKFSDPPLDACPSCGGAVRKLFSSPAIQFKGSGFYITDYPKKDQKDQPGAGKSDKTDKGESTKTDSPKTETTKTDTAKSTDGATSETKIEKSASTPATPASSPQTKDSKS